MSKIIPLRPYKDQIKPILLSLFTILLGIFLWSAQSLERDNLINNARFSKAYYHPNQHITGSSHIRAAETSVD